MNEPEDISLDVYTRFASLPEDLQAKISRAFVPPDRATIPDEIRSKLIRRLPMGARRPGPPSAVHAGTFRPLTPPVTADPAGKEA